MPELMGNPPSVKENAVPEAVPASALPQVTDGAVYLPAGEPVEPESPEFEVLLRKNLPQEILPDVLTNWRGVSARTSRLRLFAAILFLLASAAFLYYFFPPAVHPDLAQHGGLEIKYTGPSLPLSPPYRSLYGEALDSYKRGDYHRVCRILEPKVKEIIRTGDRGSCPVAFLYFRAVRKLRPNGSGNAADLLGKLMKKDPDTPAWAQFHFELSPRIRSVLDYEHVDERLHQDPGYRSAINRHRQSVDTALKALEELGPITNKGKFTKDELKKYEEDYDLFRVKILLYKWRLERFCAGRQADDEHDPGVAEREDALKLARKHENSAYKDFWQARHFIVDSLIKEDTLTNWIFWNNSVHKTLDALKEEKEKCLERMKKR